MKAAFENSKRWWKAAGLRVAKTALLTFSAYLLVGGGISDVEWTVALSGTALASLLSLLTSAVSLPEVGNEQPKWIAVASRTLKTFAQNMVAGIGPATLLNEVAWGAILDVAILAAVGSMVLAVITALPETAPDTVEVPEPEFEVPDDEEIELLEVEDESGEDVVDESGEDVVGESGGSIAVG